MFQPLTVPEVSTWLYYIKECGEYGQVVYVDVLFTYIYESPYFELTDEHSVIKLQGELYFNNNTLYYFKLCLDNSTYKFKICNDSSVSTYKVYLNDKTKYIFLASGSFDWENNEDVFEVRKLSSHLSLSSVPSAIPSITAYLSLSAYPITQPSLLLVSSTTS